MSAMQDLPDTVVVETLRQDGEFVVSRARRTEGLPSWLLVSPTSERPGPESLAQLEQAYALRDELDSSWATRPLQLVQYRRKAALILSDPGGIFLDSFLARPMEPLSFLRIALGMATAVGHFHARDLIHRDVRPANVMVNPTTGGAWLTGFGVTMRLPGNRPISEAVGTVVGTLPYMAPEQTLRINRPVDSRSDLYSLGVTLYQMLVGALPFTAGDPMEWMHCHIARLPVAPKARLKEIPEPISAIIMKLLAKNAEERYQTAAGLQADLRHGLTALGTLGKIDPFPLATHDVSGRLMIPERLYGRESEMKTLLAAFDRVLARGRTELVLVSGYSGVGKSSFVNQLRKELPPSTGLFAAGKFDQFQRGIPYATVAQGFQSLVRQLLGKREEEVVRWQDALRKALGPNGQLMAGLIPELELLIGKQSPIPDLPPQDAQNRFQMVFLRFFGVFARPRHPLVLFLDDLQWLDTATLDLIKHLVTEPDARHLLLIGAYRENEVGLSHPLSQMLLEVRQAGAPVQEIVLGPLSIENVDQLVLDALDCQSYSARSLAQLIHEKTGGNPFFAIQFLTALSEEGLLVFEPGAETWTWDLRRIHAKGFTDNIVDLMAGKLDRLPEATQEALRQMACLRNISGAPFLNIVLQDSEEAIFSMLREAVLAGLVCDLDGVFAFTHDRVQEAAYALIPEELRAQHHLRIGRSIIAKMTQDEIEEKIFDIVNQLNSGRRLISSLEEKDLVAGLNLRAGRKAKASAAYDSACIYLSAGMDLLGGEAWERRHELAFSLWLERAESEYLNGNFDEAGNLIAELLERANSKLEKVAAHRLRILLHLMQAEFQQAVDCGLECLSLFGIEMPAHPTRERVQVEYEKIWQNVGDRSVESLIDLPLMSDPEMQAALGILSLMPAPAFNTDINLLYLVFCQIVNTSLQYGATSASAHGYAELATILGPVFHRYLDGLRFGKLACSLIEKYGFDSHKAKVFFCMQRAMLWKEPIKSAIEFIRLAIAAGVETHDVLYACFSWGHLVTGLLLQGVHLEEVWRESRKGLDFVRKVKFRDFSGILLCQQRFILAMRGEEAGFSHSANTGFNEESFEAQLTAEPMPHFACHYWILKLQARFLLGDHNAASLAAKEAQALLRLSEQHIQSVDYYFYSALSAAALCGMGRAPLRSEELETLKQSLSWLQEWAESCPSTFLDKYTLVSAELARVEGRDLQSMRLYEEAIRAAHDNGFLQNEGTAHELAARFYLDRGYETIALTYLRNARHCYVSWGALGKVQQLDRRYQTFEQRVLVHPNSLMAAPSERLDLGAVTKALQAVSGQILLGKLIETLMVIAIEHAGAERGLLILPRRQDYQIEAEAKTDRDRVEVHLQQREMRPSEVPESLLRYVIRTQQSVILGDASAENLFSEDEYIRQTDPRSVLCLPLVKQGKLMGVLYLENRLAPHVFTPDRLAVLDLLASQAAISLENARLYAEVERENLERQRVEDELRRSERLMAEGQRISRTGSWAWNIQTGKLVWSAEQWRMFGLNPDAGEMTFGLLAEIIHPADRSLVLQTVDEAIGMSAAFDLEFRICMPNGEVKYIQGAGHPILEKSGELEYVGAFMDLTQQKRAEEDLRRKEADLRKSQAELAHVTRVTTMGELAASIAHEVNQPLTGIVTNGIACIRWLGAERPNLEEAKQSVNRIIRDGKRAADVIGRIRALFKKANPAREPLDLNETIREVIDLIQNELEKKQIVLRLALARELPLLLGDRVQLQQVMLNLILNAIEAMSRVEGRRRELTISTKLHGDAGVLVKVQDTGEGLDPQFVDQIFNAFQTTKKGGLGMGLSISRSIVENHSGQLWVTANDGPGATFQFTLLNRPDTGTMH
jgi:predicted ATPase/C4-dicarboxylate-specific signal transduction histidine kinase